MEFEYELKPKNKTVKQVGKLIACDGGESETYPMAKHSADHIGADKFGIIEASLAEIDLCIRYSYYPKVSFRFIFVVFKIVKGYNQFG